MPQPNQVWRGDYVLLSNGRVESIGTQGLRDQRALADIRSRHSNDDPPAEPTGAVMTPRLANRLAEIFHRRIRRVTGHFAVAGLPVKPTAAVTGDIEVRNPAEIEAYRVWLSNLDVRSQWLPAWPGLTEMFDKFVKDLRLGDDTARIMYYLLFREAYEPARAGRR